MTNNKKTFRIQGFSLVELIITIAIFGLVSGVLMRFFVIAGTAENIAYDRQQRAAISQTVLENFKHSDDMSAFINTINNGNYDSYDVSDDLETLKLSLTKAWDFTTRDNDNATYEMVVMVTSPADNLITPAATYDFEMTLETDNAVAIELTAIEDSTRGLCYMIQDGNGYSEKRNIDINSIEAVTLLINLKGDGNENVTVENKLISADEIIFSDSFKNDALNVLINRSKDNESIVTQTGGGLVTISDLSDTSTTGVYTIRIEFNEVATSENLGVFIGKKYGGM